MNQSFVPVIGLGEYVHPGCTLSVHIEPWFIPGNQHCKATGITYDSRDVKNIDRQLALIKSLGIGRVNINWYGPDNKDLDTASHNILVECANQHIPFWLCPDKGIFSGLPMTQWQSKFEDAMKYVAKYYTSSPTYWHWDGKPVINFFLNPDVPNWNNVRSILGNAILLFENKSGYDHAQSNGAYAWVNSTKGWDGVDIGLDYLHDFYSRPCPVGMYRVGGAWAGFDDTLASWSPAHTGGKARVIPRNNGCTLLQTLAAVPSTVTECLISTLNDHEEGSAIEFGIAQYN